MMTERENGKTVDIERERTKAGIDILELTYDIADSLTLKVDEGIEGAEKLRDVIDIFSAFLSSKFSHVTVRPRSAHEVDKVKFLPGQHKGITIQYATSTGHIGYLNFYGGLRDPSSPFEHRDSDTTMRIHHTRRTDVILSQPVQLNFHVKDIEETRLAEIWITYQLNSNFRLSRIRLGAESIDLHPVLLPSDYGFPNLSKNLHTIATKLITLTPST